MKKKYLIFGIVALILPVILTARAATVLFPSGGGLGTSTAPGAGQVPVGVGGIYAPTTLNIPATSTIIAGGTATGPAFTFATSTPSIFSILCGSSTCTFTQSASSTWGLEPAIIAGTGVQFWAGDKTFKTVSTTNVTEGTNLYFTTARLYSAGFITATSTGQYTTTTVMGINGAITFSTTTTGQFFTITSSSQNIAFNFPLRLDKINNLATSTGNLIVASSSVNGYGSLAVGTNGQVLTASSTAANGISWQTVTVSATPGGANTQIQYNNNGTTAGDANFTWSSTTQSLALGNAPNTFTNAIINASGTAASYLQNHLINNSAGATSTGEYVATANNGSDSLNYITFGINSSGYNAPAWSGQEADSGFLYTSDRRLFIGTATSTTNGGIVFFTGGQTSSTWRGIIDNAGKWGVGTTTTSEVLTVAGNIKLANSTSGLIFFDGGKLTGIPVTSTIAGTGISVNAATGTVTITNNGVLTIGGASSTVTLSASSSIGIATTTNSISFGAKNYPIQGIFSYATSTLYTKGTSTIQNKLITFDTTSTLRNIRVSVEGTSTSNFVTFNLYSGTSTPSSLSTTTGTFAAFTADQTVVNSTSTLLTPNASTTMCAGCFLRIFPYNASTTEFSITAWYDQN